MRIALLAGLAAFFSTAVLAQGIPVHTGGPVLEFTNCPLVGTDAGTAHNGSLSEGTYLFRTAGDDVSICVVAADAGTPTCVTGGEKYPQGFGFRWTVPRGGVKVGCRGHAGDAGDAIWSTAN